MLILDQVRCLSTSYLSKGVTLRILTPERSDVTRRIFQSALSVGELWGAEALLLILDLVFHLQSSEYLQNSLGRFGCGVGILSGNQPSINNCVARKW